MKLLLSAYPCEPDRGIEAGVGWHWILELARLGHDVWLLTRANNQQAIQRASPNLICRTSVSSITIFRIG
jgi:hypothetical protein